MTTIAWSPGVLVADTCVTEEDGDGKSLIRRVERKLKFTRFYGKRPEKGTVIAVATRGDADAGTELDELLLKQAAAILRAGGQGLQEPLNKPALLAERKKVIGEGEVDGILAWLNPRGGGTAYLISGGGRVQYLDRQWYATGSDAPIAYGALEAGKDAEFAVSAACKYGTHTARPIHVLRCVDGDVKFEELK